MNQSTIKLKKSKYDVFHEKLEAIYDFLIPWILGILIILYVLILLKEWLG